ncbi:MAG: hypothetical protein ABSF29_11895 [Tepidisphaeraceae bacterium]|jgi:hypothetical protein
MLSIDELANGKPFLLELKDTSGVAIQWQQTLRGAVAKRWYEIYRDSDWAALRLEAAGVFLNRVSPAQAEHSIKSGLCVVIKTDAVKENELVRPPQGIKATDEFVG